MVFRVIDAQQLLLSAHEQLHVDGAEIAKLHAAGVAVGALLSLYPVDMQAYVPALARVFEDVAFADRFRQAATERGLNALVTEVEFSLQENSGYAADAHFADFTWTPECSRRIEQLVAARAQGAEPTEIQLSTAEQALETFNKYLWLLSGWTPVDESERTLLGTNFEQAMAVLRRGLLEPLLSAAISGSD